MSDPHETRTESGIVIPDPDQGTPFVMVHFAMPSTKLPVWWPFEDGTDGGYNILGFAREWARWVHAEDEAYLVAHDIRFGMPLAIPRSAIPHVIGFGIDYWRREDARAGHRLAVPGGVQAQRLGNGNIEVRIPT